MYQWTARMGPGNNAVASLGHSLRNYAYGGNPAHYVLTFDTANRGIDRRDTLEADDWGTNLTDTFGNTLTKLIEYVLPRPPSRYSGTDEVLAQNLRLRRIRRVRWVDRMI